MVYKVGVQNYNINSTKRAVSFGKEGGDKKSKCENHDYLLVGEHKKSSLAIGAEKLKNAFTTYPIKGLKGSKNANFYEFLTMGTVPYLTGSALMIGVFNGASKFFNTPAMKSASKLGKKMGIGVLFYGLAKTYSKKLIELPVQWKYGIKNENYRKIVYQLPEEGNKDNLVAYEDHKAYESVDFPYWNLFYDNKHYGPKRNSYFENIAKKMGIEEEDAEYADQKTKSLIREKLVQSRVASTVSSYLWAATGVAVAMQKPWENVKFNKTIVQDVIKAFGKSCKELVTKGGMATKIAGRVLVGMAIGTTLLGNFVTLSNFNKDKGSKTEAATSLIDDSKEKVVC